MFEVKSRSQKIVIQVLATLLVIPYLFPLVVMMQGSFAGQGIENYRAVLRIELLPYFFRNSIIIAAAVIAIVYVCTILAAFGFAKLRIRGKEIVFWVLMAALTLPEVVILTPLFATASSTGLYDTLWSVILPLSALQIPFTVLLCRNYITGIPDELLESARIDGATTLQVFRHVVAPLTKPIGAAIVVLTLITSWNDYLLPLVFLQSDQLQTVTLVPQFFVSQFNNDQTKVLAAAVICALPEVLAYLLMQKNFERGLTAGALK
jgi:ABC-type glycerol-3-phosphate transport system permease component